MIILVSWLLDNRLKFSLNIYIYIYNFKNIQLYPTPTIYIISKDIQFYPTPTTRKQQVWTVDEYTGSDNSKEHDQESKA